MAEELPVHTSLEVPAFEFVCPRCEAVVVRMGRVVVAPDERRGDVVCDGCGAAFRLGLEPPEG